MLPPTWRIALAPGTRRLDDGQVLVGGAPSRILRLNPAAARVVARLASGTRIGTSSGPQQLARRLLDAGMAHPRPDAATHRWQDVTVVMPFHGRSEELDATLTHIGPAARVIVIDDASTDPTVAATASRHGAEVHRHPANLGPGAARNTGMAIATTELIAFVDGGCVPEEGWLDALLPHLDDPMVAAVAPRIIAAAPATLPATLAAYEQARPTLDRGPDEATVRPRSPVPFVPTATLLARRSTLLDVGGFDETMRFGEDVDLVWRLVEHGHTIRYVPSAHVTHDSRPTTSAWLRQRFDYGRSAAPLARRHGVDVAALAVSPWTAAAWALVACGAAAPGAAVAVGSSVGLASRLDGIDHRGREALRLATSGHLHGGLAIGQALRRPWWPFALLGAIGSRRVRRAVLAATVVPVLVEWWKLRPPLDPVRWTAVRLVDDIAYGAGVWAGCWRERSFAAIAPDLTNWPRRTRPTAPQPRDG